MHMTEENEFNKIVELRYLTNNEKKAYLDGYEDALNWVEEMKKEK